MANILLVDDDPDILRILAAAFETAGHSVGATTDPTDGRLQKGAFDFDAVILDVMMPGRSGWEVLQDLRSRPDTERTPVLMLSAVGDAPNRVRGLRLGADDFVAKPFYPEEVLARIEGLIQRRAAEPPVVWGDLAALPLCEILRSLADSRVSGVLDLVTPGERGWLRFAEGACLQASWSDLDGSEAVLAMTRQRTGKYSLRLEPWADVDAGAEPLPLSRLMLEAVWIEDELHRRLSLLPPEDHGLRAVGGTARLSPPPGLPPLPLDPILFVLRDHPGTTLGRLLDLCLAAPDRVRLAVAWLFETKRVSAIEDRPAERVSLWQGSPPEGCTAG